MRMYGISRTVCSNTNCFICPTGTSDSLQIKYSPSGSFPGNAIDLTTMAPLPNAREPDSIPRNFANSLREMCVASSCRIGKSRFQLGILLSSESAIRPVFFDHFNIYRLVYLQVCASLRHHNIHFGIDDL